MKKQLFNLSKNIYIQGSILLTITGFIASGINYLFHFLVGRLLGPTGYGDITTLYSYILISSVPVSVMSTYIIQKISSVKDNQLAYVKNIQISFWGMIKKYFLFFILLFGVVPILPSITKLPLLITILMLPMIYFTVIFSFYNSIFSGLKMFLVVGLLQILFPVSKLLSILPAFAVKINSGFIILIQLTAGILLLIFATNKIKKLTMPLAKNFLKTNYSLKQVIDKKYFYITLLSVLGITMLSNIDIIFVKRYFPSDISGIYNSWSLFAKIILYISGPAIPVTFVYFSSDSNQKKQNKIMVLFLVLLSCLFVLFYFIYKLFGSLIILLLFGDKFSGIIPYLDKAAIFGSMYCLITLFNNFFLAKKSVFSLLLILAIPIYSILLFLNKSTLVNIMNINIYFSAFLVLIYLISLVYYFKKYSSIHKS